MEGSLFVPVVIHVVAHFLHLPSDKVRAWRRVRALCYLNGTGSPLARIIEDAGDSHLLKLPDQTRPKCKGPIGLKKRFYYIFGKIELVETILDLKFCNPALLGVQRRRGRTFRHTPFLILGQG